MALTYGSPALTLWGSFFNFKNFFKSETFFFYLSSVGDKKLSLQLLKLRFFKVYRSEIFCTTDWWYFLWFDCYNFFVFHSFLIDGIYFNKIIFFKQFEIFKPLPLRYLKIKQNLLYFNLFFFIIAIERYIKFNSLHSTKKVLKKLHLFDLLFDLSKKKEDYRINFGVEAGSVNLTNSHFSADVWGIFEGVVTRVAATNYLYALAGV